MSVARDLRGERFGRLVALSRAEPKGRDTRWLCQCDCGQSRVVASKHLVDGTTRSCKCLQREAAGARASTHRMTLSPEYQSWHGAKDRCFNPRSKFWRYYGGRGIVVCDQWKNSFETFFADMGQKPSPDHSLDRIDSDGPYSPENCRWATDVTQNRNRRNSVRVMYRGEIVTVAELAERYGLKPESLRANLRRTNRSPEEAVALSVARKNRQSLRSSVEPLSVASV